MCSVLLWACPSQPRLSFARRANTKVVGRVLPVQARRQVRSARRANQQRAPVASKEADARTATGRRAVTEVKRAATTITGAKAAAGRVERRATTFACNPHITIVRQKRLALLLTLSRASIEQGDPRVHSLPHKVLEVEAAIAFAPPARHQDNGAIRRSRFLGRAVLVISGGLRQNRRG